MNCSSPSFRTALVGYPYVFLSDLGFLDDFWEQFMAIAKELAQLKTRTLYSGFQKPHFGNTVWPCEVQQIVMFMDLVF